MAQLPAPLGQCHSDDPFSPPPPCGKGFSPVLTLELGKGYSDHPAHTVNPSPKTGKKCNDLPHPRDPSSCLTGKSPSVPRRIPAPPPPAPSSLPQSSFEPCSPTLLGRPCCHGPRLSGSSPTSPCIDRLGFLGPPPHRQRSPYCSLAGTPRMQRPCPSSSLFDQRTYLYYCSPVTVTPLAQPPGTSPVTSPQLIHIPLETGPIISPPLTPESEGTCPMISPPLIHRTLGTVLSVSPPLAHRPMETRPIVSTTLSHGPVISPLVSHWSSGRSYNDPPPPPPSASSRPDSLCHDHHKPSDSCEPKSQLDVPPGKNCGSSLPSQAGISGSPSSPQEGSFHYSHISSEAHISAPGSPYCAIRLPTENTGSSCSPQFQAPKKPCFESLLSWGTGGSSYLLLTPGTKVSGPPCPSEPPLSHCPYSDLYFPSPLGNQFIAPPQTVPRRSYNEPPLPTPVSPHMKSPKSSEVRQPCTPHKCRSLVNTAQHTPGQPKPPESCTSPLPPHQPSGLSGGSCMESSITAPSNCCTKELPPGTPLPSVVPGVIKTVFPTSHPLCVPCDPILPNSYAKNSPHGASLVSPCNTHMYSVVPPTCNPCPPSSSLTHSTGPPQCHNQPVVPPCGTYGAPRGPPLLPCKPVMPPCSTHIYSFIPLRTPFDPQCLPIVPRVRPCPDNMPCGLHTYSVASQGPCKESPQIPYSCPLPSPKSSICSTNVSCSSTIVNECRSSDSQTKSSRQSKSRSQSRSPRRSRSQSQSKSSHSRSRSRSSSPHQVVIQDRKESPRSGRSRKRSKSPRGGKSQGKSKSPRYGRSWKRSKSPRTGKSHGRSKSSQNKKK